MDDPRQNVLPLAESYRCPGESQTIDRAAHLGRLANYFPACRHCDRRHETGLFSAGQRAQLAELEGRVRPQVTLASEGFVSSGPEGIERLAIERIATSLAEVLWQRAAETRPPAILVGFAGDWTGAERMAAACAALATSGCRAIETQGVTSASLSLAAHALEADAAMWLGNAMGEPHQAGVRLWGKSGSAWSSPGDLDAVWQAFEQGPNRPRRHGGSHDRTDSDAPYTKTLASWFHALRPLRFVIDTTCAPLLRYLDGLVAHTACQVLRFTASSDLARRPTPNESFLVNRLRRLGAQVSLRSAHFGVWIDGDAETLWLVNERGQVVPHERLLQHLTAYVLRLRSDAPIVVSRDVQLASIERLASTNVPLHSCDATRQDVAAAMRRHGALLGIGPHQRLWYANPAPAADSLMTVCLLLAMLSESDLDVSEVFGEKCNAGLADV